MHAKNGLELSAAFFADVIQPILQRNAPGLRYAAGLIGPGSEVLGYDTAISQDHDWGPRLQIFLEDSSAPEIPALNLKLASDMPSTYRGLETKFPITGDQIQRHRVELQTKHDFFHRYLEIDISGPTSVVEWLSLPFNKLRSVVAGAVFHDEIGLREVRDRFRFYPNDVFLYVLAYWLCSYCIQYGGTLEFRSVGRRTFWHPSLYQSLFYFWLRRLLPQLAL